MRFTLFEGFIAGAFAAATFHQPVAAVLHALALYPVAPFDLSPRPSGLPGLVNSMLWSGGWGVVFLLARRWPPFGRLPLAAAAIGYTLTVPIAYLFLVLTAWHGAPFAFGMPPHLIAAVLAAHGAWGFGIALWLAGMRGLLRR